MRWRVLGTILLLAHSAAAAEVRLRSSVACGTAIVRLADVAEIRAETGAQCEALSMIALCPAPGGEHEITLTQHEVRQALALSGVELKQVTVTGSEAVSILGETSSKAARPPMLAAGAVRQALHALEERPAPLVVVPQPSAAVSAAAASGGSVGGIVKPVRLVERGSNVTIHSRKPGVRITSSGKSLAHGTAGELISVEVGDAKQQITARVIGPQVVEIATSSTNAAGSGR